MRFHQYANVVVTVGSEGCQLCTGVFMIIVSIWGRCPWVKDKVRTAQPEPWLYYQYTSIHVLTGCVLGIRGGASLL